ncbi:MAG: hypothetical protein JWO46_3104 [Nocardioidaceae bacterium]|nr:hypothetical protein [Nocardioidaceae bacterium]
MILGVTGSGKSSLATRVGELLGVPAVATDDIYWQPGWVKAPVEERARRYAALAAGDAWVVDGLPGSGRDVLLSRADLVVGLDYPRWVSLGRLLRRTARRLVTRETFCNGNTERLRETLSRDSIVAWHFRSYAERRADIAALEADPAAPPVVRLTSQRATDDWLRALAGS